MDEVTRLVPRGSEFDLRLYHSVGWDFKPAEPSGAPAHNHKPTWPSTQGTAKVQLLNKKFLDSQHDIVLPILPNMVNPAS